jgi:chorismate dehydratase
MVTCELKPPGISPLPRVCAVSYLNTVPLVWGFLRGPQQGLADIEFRVPSECARLVDSGGADAGIVPVVEIERQGLSAIPGTGIACHGPVRSILLVSRVEPRAIRRLACDSGSRTSVMLARVVLRQRFGADPALLSMPPDLDRMLAEADAALLIGDAALRVDPATLPYAVLDLGEEWLRLTGLPMVFAVWAGKPEGIAPLVEAGFEAAFRESLDCGLRNIATIVDEESRRRALPRDLVEQYLTRHIAFEIGVQENEGMARFLQSVAEIETAAVR